MYFGNAMKMLRFTCTTVVCTKYTVHTAVKNKFFKLIFLFVLHFCFVKYIIIYV